MRTLDIDIYAGIIMNGVQLADFTARIFEKLIAVAEGQQTKSEAQGLGEVELPLCLSDRQCK